MSRGHWVYVILFLLWNTAGKAGLQGEEVNLVGNGGFEEVTPEWDPWDGVGPGGQVEVFSASYKILVSGYRGSTLSFGASPVAGDLNGDGLLDLVVGDGIGFIWVFLSHGRGPGGTPLLGPGQPIPSFFGGALKICLVDWEGDGDQDILAGNHYGWLMLVTNIGTPAQPLFTSAMGKPRYIPHGSNHPGYALKPLSWGAEPILFGHFMAPWVTDWDEDGAWDLIVGEGTYSANSIWLIPGRFRSRGATLSFDQGKRSYLAYGYGREHLVPSVCDLDKDGRRELLVTDRKGTLGVYRQVVDSEEGEDVLSRVTEFIPDGLGKTDFLVVSAVDWDADGVQDLLAGHSEGGVFWLKGEQDEGDVGWRPGPAVEVAAESDRGEVFRAMGWHFSLRGHCNSAFHPTVVEASAVGRFNGARAGVIGRCLQVEYAHGYSGFTQHSRGSGLFGGGWVPGARYFLAPFEPGVAPGDSYHMELAAVGNDIELGIGIAASDSFQSSLLAQKEFRLTDKWRKYTCDLHIPRQGTKKAVRSSLRLYFKGTTGRCWVDSVSLTRK